MTALDVSRFDRIVFFTGAGLSKESGIPTYRGRGGVWKDYDYTSCACQEAFERDPEKVWDFHDLRRERAAAAAPSPGHLLIAAVQREHDDVTVITQNIDGLHQRAGSSGVLELHGSLWRVRCERERTVHDAPTQPLPSRRCACGAWLRPDIVWFGDALDGEVLGRAATAAAASDLFVSVGTSLVVYPAAHLPALARREGATCVEINPEPSALADAFHVVLRQTAAEGLAALWPALAAQATARPGSAGPPPSAS